MSTKIMIVSDGTGDTATSFTRAAMAQFSEEDVLFTRYRNVKNKDELQPIIQEASIHHQIVIYTIVNPKLRKEMDLLCKEKNIPFIDLMGPVVQSLSQALSLTPNYKAGTLNTLNSDYYKSIDALEFTMKYDNSPTDQSMEEADIILLGISRTSKTPLSIYLSLEGFKTVNLTLKENTPIPDKIWDIDQRKLYVLTISPDILLKYRKQKAKKNKEQYDEEKILSEYHWSLELYKKNLRWPVFNVSEKTLKETSSDIQKIYETRQLSKQKQKLRYN